MARQSQIIQPSQDDLLRALTAGQGGIDTSAAVRSAAGGEDLASTILKNKQAQEDRIRTLQEKIAAAKREREQQGRIQAFRDQPSVETATSAFPDVAGKELLGRKPETPKTPTYTKIGEATDEIILADLVDPSRQFRVKAPGIGSKGGRGDSALAVQTEKDRAKVIIDKAKSALGLVGPLTTGKGSAIADVPFFGRGSKAGDLRGTADTIKANLGFEQLAKMRQASPTGGALGQIAVRELEFLQAAVANLNTQQSEDLVRQNIKEVIARYQNWLDTTEGRNPSYPNGAADVPTPGNEDTPPPAGNPGQSGGLSPEKAARLAELRAKKAAGTLR